LKKETFEFLLDWLPVVILAFSSFFDWHKFMIFSQKDFENAFCFVEYRVFKNIVK